MPAWSPRTRLLIEVGDTAVGSCEVSPRLHPSDSPSLKRLWTRSVLAPGPWSRWLIGGILGVAAVAAADTAVGSQQVLASALAVVALIIGVGGRRGDAGVTALVAVVVAALSGLRDGWGPDYTIALVVVVAASLIATLLALVRVSATVSRRQVALLRHLLELANGSPEVETIGDRLLDLLVPAMGDSCALDLVTDGRQRRLGARVSGPHGEELAAGLRDRPLSAGPSPGGASRAMASGESQLVEVVEDGHLRAMAHDAADLELLKRLDTRSAMFLPMVTRASPFGAIALGVGSSGRRYTLSDLSFAELVASRMAIVLDNAGLWREAERTERRMIAALDALEEAVTMNGRDGRTVYANQAAVELLRAESSAELCNAPPGAISARFDNYDEDGGPVDYRQMPAFKALAGEEHPPAALVRNVVRATGEERWLLNKVSVLRDVRGAVDRVVNVIEDVTEVKRSELDQRLLAEATRVLSDSLDYRQTLQHVAEIAVPEMAEWCGVDVPGPSGRIHAVAIAHSDPAKRALGQELRKRYPVDLDSPTELARVISTGGSHLVPSISDSDLEMFAVDERHLELLRGVGFGSILIVAMTAGARTLGAVTLVRSDPARPFTEADQRLASELGRRAGIAVLNAQLYTERMTITQDLQEGLRPPDLAAVPGLETATLYRPAGELNDVGGDFYDAFATPAGWMTVIGDVAGHGARAAALTGLARFTLRAVGQLTGDPTAAAAQVNRTLRDQPAMSLCTIAMLLLHRDEGGELALAALSCGHPLPVLVRDGEPIELGRPGPLTGAFDDVEWPIATTRLLDGDTVILYTDGVLDTVGVDERFGGARLLDVLARGAKEPGLLIERIDAALSEFQIGSQSDDTAIVALKVRDAAALAEAVSQARETAT